MARETLLHIDETLTEEQREELLNNIKTFAGNVKTHYQSDKPHLLFITYNEELAAPQELVTLADTAGVSAQLINW